MKCWSRGFAGVVAFGAMLGCSATVVVADGGVTDAPPVTDAPVVDVTRPTRVPVRHRAAAMACPAERPGSSCMNGIGGPTPACTSDTECTTGTNGRCVGNPHDGCRCNYDACASDGDCTTGGPCECRLASRGAAGANVCVAGNCRVDADCDGGRGYCSPTLGFCGEYGGLSGYYCHTARDECVDDADCVTGDAGFLGQRPYCMYAPEVGRWTCSNQGCAG